METRPHTIVSYCRGHSDLKDFFTSMLQDMGFTCECLDETCHSSEASIRANIEAADCFIGLLTPDQPTENGELTCSAATLIQLAVAHMAQKPVQLFAFDTVDVSEIVFPLSTNIARIQLFKTKFGKSIIFDANNARLIFKTMLAFKQQVEQTLLQKEKA